MRDENRRFENSDLVELSPSRHESRYLGHSATLRLPRNSPVLRILLRSGRQRLYDIHEGDEILLQKKHLSFAKVSFLKIRHLIHRCIKKQKRIVEAILHDRISPVGKIQECVTIDRFFRRRSSVNPTTALCSPMTDSISTENSSRRTSSIANGADSYRCPDKPSTNAIRLMM